MDAIATRRAVHDVLTHGLRDDLSQSAVGVELGAQLQSGLTADVADGASPGELLVVLRDACDQDPVAYARILELIVLAGLDELQLIAGIEDSDISPAGPEIQPAPPRRSARRRR